jgi:hypothetical protein
MIGANIPAPPAAAVTAGSTNMWIPASAFIPTTTTGCGVNSVEMATNKINYDALEFDTAVTEFAQFMTVMPNNYNLGTVQARFFWTATTGSGTVEWAIAGRSYANDDAIDQALGTLQATNDTLLAANDVHITGLTPAVTITGGPALGEPVQFQISRQPGNDTLAVDARLLGVEIVFN